MPEDWDLEDEWVEADDSPKKGVIVPTRVDDAVYDDGSEETPGALNVAFLGYEHSGKSILYTLSGYFNQKWWTTSPAKEGGHIRIDKYPKCKQLIKQGVVPEIETLQVIDLDCSYGALSKLGIFGKLARPLYKNKVIKRTSIPIPQRQAGLVNNRIKEISIRDFDITKQKIDNEISKAVEDNPETTALAIDSMTSLDELLNNKFRVLYEVALAPIDRGKRKGKDYYGSSLDGIKQSYWKIRNGWWVSTLRTKRQYKGWQFDTYKIETKHPVWLKKEKETAEEEGKDVSKVKDYKIEWAPKTKYDLDLILWLENNGVKGIKGKYWTKIKNRFEGSSIMDDEFHREVHYTPRRVCAFYDLVEQLAPSILGEVEKEDGSYEDDDIFGESVIFR